MSEAADGVGTLATGAMWAREAETLAGHGQAHDETGPCANCGARRVGPYCHACGQAGHVHRSLAALIHDIAHGVFHFEGKVWHTLPLLAWRPGALTRRYVEGERVKFVSPMALFLFSVFLMFAVVSNVGNHAKVAPPAGQAKTDPAVQLQTHIKRLATLKTERAKAQDPEVREQLGDRIDKLQDEIEGLKLAVRAKGVLTGHASGQTDPVRLNTGWEVLDDVVSDMSANPELSFYKMKSYAYKYSWALIPISLPFLWLLFPFRRGIGLYDHAIFSIYSLSFMSLGVVVLTLLSRVGVPGWVIATMAVFVPPVHMYRQLKGAYRLGWFGALWRTVALLIIVSITSLLFVIFLFWMGSH